MRLLLFYPFSFCASYIDMNFYLSFVILNLRISQLSLLGFMWVESGIFGWSSDFLDFPNPDLKRNYASSSNPPGHLRSYHFVPLTPLVGFLSYLGFRFPLILDRPKISGSYLCIFHLFLFLVPFCMFLFSFYFLWIDLGSAESADNWRTSG